MSGQVWAVNSLGGFLFSLNLSKELRTYVQPKAKFRQFAKAKNAAQNGRKKGDVFHWDIISDVTTQGNYVAETDTAPKTGFTISQGTLTITEAINSVPFTQKLDNLSEHPIKNMIRTALKNDAAKFFDIKAFDQFNATKLRIVPTAGTSTSAVTLTTNGTATLTNNQEFKKQHVRAVVDLMNERDIPGYYGDDYVALSHPTTFSTLKDDLEGVYQYTQTGFIRIAAGEIGRYQGMRFVEQNNIPKGGAADSTAFNPLTKTADAWNKAASSWIFFFGDDTVAEGIAVPEEIRGKIPQDFGRDMGFAWYYLGGFGIVHTLASQSRIVKWDSAA